MTTKPNGTEHPRFGYDFAGVPNTKAGRRFIEQLRTYINRPATERVRILCNGPRNAAREAEKRANPDAHTWHYDSYLPQRHAKTFRVYIDRKAESEAMRERYDLMEQVRTVRAANEKFSTALTALQHDNHDLTECVSALHESRKRLAEANVALRDRYQHVPLWLAHACAFLAQWGKS